jgi:hypothetical protein
MHRIVVHRIVVHRIVALLLMGLPASSDAQEVAPLPRGESRPPARVERAPAAAPSPVLPTSDRDEGAPRAGVWLGGALHSNLPSVVDQVTRDFVVVGLRRAWPLGGRA